jgi:hypothetical protein
MFKLVPRHFDKIISVARTGFFRVQSLERIIMSANEAYSSSLGKQRENIILAQKRLTILVRETGLNIAEIKDINRRMSLGEAKTQRAKKERTFGDAAI